MGEYSLTSRCFPVAFLLTLSTALSCVHPLPAAPAAEAKGPAVGGYRYFERPDAYDPWSLKIAQWQASQRAEREADLPPVGTDPNALQSKYSRFRSELRVDQARQVAAWIQKQARSAYNQDPAGDPWPTVQEVLASRSDDCDGLELIVHHLLLELGFPTSQVYRAVVHRPSDGQHHMVTLWFQDSDDPWVIDPTGAMTHGMPRMSQVPDWVPLKLFSASQEFTVHPTVR